MGHKRTLSRWLLLGEWQAHKVQAATAIISIALGVALGYAIHLLNAAAFNEFSAAARSLSGQSDLQVRSAQSTFDESIYPLLARHNGVELANPVLEIDAALPGGDEERKRAPLKILGLDIFRASVMAPDLIGIPAEDKLFDILADDAIFLSPAAMEWLEVKQGDLLQLRVGTQPITLRVAGGLARVRAGQRLAVMDVGAAQWRFQRLGQLSRIELKLVRGVDRSTFKTELTQELAARGHFLISETADQEVRVANMSRAYRVNLNMLAMVALFTGAFLVFSTQALSVVRRRHQFALLRVLGFTRSQLLRQILVEGSVLGATGSIAGLALGYLTAVVALHYFGGDLGGGFFPGIKPSVNFDASAAIVFFILGSGVTLLGSAVPAWEAANTRPSSRIKSGQRRRRVSKTCHALARAALPGPGRRPHPIAAHFRLAPLWVPRRGAPLDRWHRAHAPCFCADFLCNIRNGIPAWFLSHARIGIGPSRQRSQPGFGRTWGSPCQLYPDRGHGHHGGQLPDFRGRLAETCLASGFVRADRSERRHARPYAGRKKRDCSRARHFAG